MDKNIKREWGVTGRPVMACVEQDGQGEDSTKNRLNYTGGGEAKKAAFTLAEVLITLAIIGVVAALTIPSVVKNYQKQQTLAKFKKFYSEFHQALNLSLLENGSLDTWDFTKANCTKFPEKYLFPYMKILKNCDSGDGCIGHKYGLISGGTKNLSSTTKTSFITADGVGVGIYCVTDNMNYFAIDLDGPEKGYGAFKSTMGKDRFEFRMYKRATQRQLLGVSFCETDAQGNLVCNRQTTLNGCKTDGASCSTLLIYEDKWDMKDDYPW